MDGSLTTNNEEKKTIIIANDETEEISLEEKFKEYDGDNLSKDFEWDDPVGKEIL